MSTPPSCLGKWGCSVSCFGSCPDDSYDLCKSLRNVVIVLEESVTKMEDPAAFAEVSGVRIDGVVVIREEADPKVRGHRFSAIILDDFAEFEDSPARPGCVGNADCDWTDVCDDVRTCHAVARGAVEILKEHDPNKLNCIGTKPKLKPRPR